MKQQLGYNLKLIFNTSIGIFLFILFFQPFDASFENINSLIIFFAGFGGIVFILNSLSLIALPAMFPKALKIGDWQVGPPFLLNALIVTLNSVAFPFYLRFVGRTTITFDIVIQIVLIHLSAVIILRLVYIIKYQKQDLEFLQSKLGAKNVELNDELLGNIILYSENKTEKIKLENNDLFYLKAADNYVEVYFIKNNTIQKKLLRNTLKNIDLQLSTYNNFVRCHRTFLVNLNLVEKLGKNYKGHYLKIKEISYEIPVSRHYLLKVKEQLNQN